MKIVIKITDKYLSKVKKHGIKILILFAYLVSAIVALALVIYSWHLLAPIKSHFLSHGQVQNLGKMLSSTTRIFEYIASLFRKQ